MTPLVQQILKTNILSQLSGKQTLPLNIMGGRGLGKTSMIKQITEDIGSQLVNVSIPSKNIEFFSG